MSEKYSPRDGERVRVTLEGQASRAGEEGEFVIGVSWINRIHPAAAHVVSVEKLPDPIPTTPGTVLWVNGNGACERSYNVWWIAGKDESLTDRKMAELATDYGFTVLREGKP